MTDRPVTQSELLAMVKKAHQSLEPWGALVEEIKKLMAEEKDDQGGET